MFHPTEWRSRPSVLAGAALAWICCRADPVWASEPLLELRDCASLSHTATRELLAIELRTLGVVPSPRTLWIVLCHGQSATVELSHSAESSGESRGAAPVGDAPTPIRASARVQIDLSSTDEAAWPRLIALSASELAEQWIARTTRLAPEQRALAPSVKMVSFAAKNKKASRYRPTVGLSFSRLGEPGTWLYGPDLGAEWRLGKVGLVANDWRAQWGRSTLADANVAWQLLSVAVSTGLTLDLGPFAASAVVGMRVGQLRLIGEAKSAEASGRKLAGLTGGPLVGLRLRTAPTWGPFAGVHLEAGYSWWPVRGSYDGTTPLVSVEATWVSTALNLGWAF